MLHVTGGKRAQETVQWYREGIYDKPWTQVGQQRLLKSLCTTVTKLVAQ